MGSPCLTNGQPPYNAVGSLGNVRRIEAGSKERGAGSDNALRFTKVAPNAITTTNTTPGHADRASRTSRRVGQCPRRDRGRRADPGGHAKWHRRQRRSDRLAAAASLDSPLPTHRRLHHRCASRGANLAGPTCRRLVPRTGDPCGILPWIRPTRMGHAGPRSRRCHDARNYLYWAPASYQYSGTPGTGRRKAESHPSPEAETASGVFTTSPLGVWVAITPPSGARCHVCSAASTSK